MGPNPPGSVSSNLNIASQTNSKTNQTMIDAAPPEEVMPFSRDNSDNPQQDIKALNPSGILVNYFFFV